MKKHLITGPFIKRTGQDFGLVGAVVRGLPAHAVDTWFDLWSGKIPCQGATQAEQNPITEFQELCCCSPPLSWGTDAADPCYYKDTVNGSSFQAYTREQRLAPPSSLYIQQITI